MNQVSFLFFAVLLTFSGCSDITEIWSLDAKIKIEPSGSFLPGEKIILTYEKGGLNKKADFSWKVNGRGTVQINNGISLWNGEIELDPYMNWTFRDGYEELHITPFRSGVIEVELTLDNGDKVSRDRVELVIENTPIQLTEVPTGYTFYSLNNGDVADYHLVGDMVLPDVKFKGDVSFEIDEGAMITIDGELGVRDSVATYGQFISFQNSDGPSWKGIFVTKNGVIDSLSIHINNAGKSGMKGYPPASIVLENDRYSYTSISTYGALGFDMVIDNFPKELNWRLSRLLHLTSGKGIYGKAKWWPELEFLRSESIHELTIEGDINIPIQCSTDQIFMNWDLSLIGGINYDGTLEIQIDNYKERIINMSDQSAVISKGLIAKNVSFENSGEGWKGLYLSGDDVVLDNVTVLNAGHSPIVTPDISNDKSAALFIKGDLDQMTNCSIINSEGYGVYVENLEIGLKSREMISDNLFKNIASVPVSVPQQWGGAFSYNGTFDPLTTRPTIEVRRSDNLSSYFVYSSLGDVGYYKILDDLIVKEGSIGFGAGSHLVFEKGKRLHILNGANFGVSGTKENPVVLEGNEWIGVQLGSQDIGEPVLAFAENLTIKGGGFGIAPGASESAGLSIRTSKTEGLYRDPDFYLHSFFIENSGGYGVVIEPESEYSYEELGTNINFTFLNNASGDVLDKTQ